jgi:hypothetical protein
MSIGNKGDLCLESGDPCHWIHFSRIGRVTWQIGHGANVVLRQLGILMFLACAGLGSGTAFAEAVVTRRGLEPRRTVPKTISAAKSQ